MLDQQWHSCFRIVLGAWLALSPPVLGLEHVAAINCYAVGAALIFTTAIPLSTVQSFHLTRWRDLLFLALSAWLIVSPWLLHMTAPLSHRHAIILGDILILSPQWSESIYLDA